MKTKTPKQPKPAKQPKPHREIREPQPSLDIEVKAHKLKKDFQTELRNRVDKILRTHPNPPRKFSTDEQRVEFVNANA